jgi:hypothetical protein
MDHTRKDSIEKHFESERHQKWLVERDTAFSRGSSLLNFVVAATKVPIGEGANLPVDQKAWRLRVLSTFLENGVPVNKINNFRPLFESNSQYSLTDASHLAKLIPVLHSSMQAKTKEMIKGRWAVVLFDGTPHIGEVVSIVVRFYHNQRVRQRILDFIHLNKSPDANELFRVALLHFPPLYSLMSALVTQQGVLDFRGS